MSLKKSISINDMPEATPEVIDHLRPYSYEEVQLALAYAANAALTEAPHSTHSYLPNTPEEAKDFRPHLWVIAAICAAMRGIREGARPVHSHGACHPRYRLGGGGPGTRPSHGEPYDYGLCFVGVCPRGSRGTRQGRGRCVCLEHAMAQRHGQAKHPSTPGVVTMNDLIRLGKFLLFLVIFFFFWAACSG